MLLLLLVFGLMIINSHHVIPSPQKRAKIEAEHWQFDHPNLGIKVLKMVGIENALVLPYYETFGMGDYSKLNTDQKKSVITAIQLWMENGYQHDWTFGLRTTHTSLSGKCIILDRGQVTLFDKNDRHAKEKAEKFMKTTIKISIYLFRSHTKSFYLLVVLPLHWKFHSVPFLLV